MDAATVKQLVAVLGDPSMYDEDGIMHITQDAMRKVLAMIVSLQSELTCAELKGKWIPFSESLPPDDRQTVLMSDGEDRFFGWRNPKDEMNYVNECLNGYLTQRGKTAHKFTHWMQLPEPPKAGEQE